VIELGVAQVMALKAAGIDLDGAGSATCVSALDCFARRLGHCEEIVVADQAEPRRAFGDVMASDVVVDPVPSQYWLFSNTKTAGSFSTAAMIIASKVVPWFEPPSPIKETATVPRPNVAPGVRAQSKLDAAIELEKHIMTTMKMISGCGERQGNQCFLWQSRTGLFRV